jgi:hypothetical protein
MGQVVDKILGVPESEKFAPKARIQYAYSQQEAKRALKTRKRVSRSVMRRLAAQKKVADEKQLEEDLREVRKAFREQKINKMTETLEKYIYDNGLPLLSVPKEWYSPQHKKLSLVVNLLAYSVSATLPTTVGGFFGFTGLTGPQTIAYLPSAQEAFRDIINLAGSQKAIHDVFSPQKSAKVVVKNFTIAVASLAAEQWGGQAIAHVKDIVSQLEILKKADVAPVVIEMINEDTVRQIVQGLNITGTATP